MLKDFNQVPNSPTYTADETAALWNANVKNLRGKLRGFEELTVLRQNQANAANPMLAQEEIRLIARDQQSGQEGVRFYVTPELNETRTVNYQEYSEMRQAGGILIYIGTQARTYQLSARMVSRSQREADLTYVYTHRLKAWTTPKYDKTGGAEHTDNAPEVLQLYGYGDERQLRGVPTVITSLSIDYPANVSYIQATNGAWIPIIQNFTISLKEARGVTELENFNLKAFKEGTLLKW